MSVENMSTIQQSKLEEFKKSLNPKIEITGTLFAETTNSIYIYGKYNGEILIGRISDHHSHNGYCKKSPKQLAADWNRKVR